MAPTRLRFLRAAANELAAAVGYYEAARPGLGQRFAAEVRAATARSLATPEGGAPRTEPASLARGIRSRRVTDFPYAVVYCVVGDALVVVAVAHDRQRPGYWLRRI